MRRVNQVMARRRWADPGNEEPDGVAELVARMLARFIGGCRSGVAGRGWKGPRTTREGELPK
jgi:hypothetical protein